MSENNLKQAYQLVRKNPDDPQVWRNLGKLLQASGDKEKATQCFQHARQLAATQTPSPPTQPSDRIGSPAGEGSAGRLRSGLGKAIQQGKTTVKHAAQAAQDADLANKAGRAAEGVTAAASQVSRFAAEHQDTARQIGKTALDTTTQVGQTATKIRSSHRDDCCNGQDCHDRCRHCGWAVRAKCCGDGDYSTGQMSSYNVDLHS